MKIRFLFFLIFLLSFNSFCQVNKSDKLYCSTNNLTAQNNFNLGNEALEKGDLDEELKLFSYATTEDSLFCEAWDNLAVVMRRKGEYNKALTFYLKSYNINNKNDIACTNAGEILLLSNKKELAFKWFTRAMHINSLNPEAYFGRAKCFMLNENFKNALKEINKSIKLYKVSKDFIPSDVNFTKGMIYFGKGDISSAKKILESEYQNFSDNPSMNYFLGLCYLDPKYINKELARDYLNKAQAKGLKIDIEILDKLEK